MTVPQPGGPLMTALSACHVEVYKARDSRPHYPWITTVRYGEQSNFWVYETHLEALAKAVELAELDRVP